MAILSIIKRLKGEITGATAIEYALLAGLLSIAIISSSSNIGSSAVALFGTIDTQVGIVGDNARL